MCQTLKIHGNKTTYGRVQFVSGVTLSLCSLAVMQWRCFFESPSMTQSIQQKCQCFFFFPPQKKKTIKEISILPAYSRPLPHLCSSPSFHPPPPPSRSSVSIQDPFSEVSDPAFQKRAAPLPPSAPYQQGLSMPDMMMRMQYESKDPFAGMRKSEWDARCDALWHRVVAEGPLLFLGKINRGLISKDVQCQQD